MRARRRGERRGCEERLRHQPLVRLRPRRPPKQAASSAHRWRWLRYSFDQDLVHWVAISTEVRARQRRPAAERMKALMAAVRRGAQVYAYYADPVEQQRQLRWLESDLQKANANRAKRPWIIM
jgi:hypothetical protein